MKEHLKRKTLPSLLNAVPVRVGDVFLVPAGTVHAIGGGILLAEVQQASDVPYRLDDWDRVGSNGPEKNASYGARP